MSAKIAAVVVTYNRKALLAECLEALLAQSKPLDAIVVVDNASTDGTREFLLQSGYNRNPTITVLDLPINVGGAGGFHAGMSRAIERGFDWIWVMDDDAEPAPDALEELCAHLGTPGICGLACLPVVPSGGVLYSHRGGFDFSNPVAHALVIPIVPKDITDCAVGTVEFASFVGLMVSRPACEQVGLPKKELFLHGDDIEFCVRLGRVGRILLVCQSVITHKEAAVIETKRRVRFRLVGSNRPTVASLARTYFMRRNYVWIASRNGGGLFKVAKGVLRSALRATRSTVGILLFDRDKFVRLRLIWGALVSGLVGDFDNDFPRRMSQLGTRL